VSINPPARGRPRRPGTGDAILSAARTILTESGYQGLSFEEVAARAGVTRPTIYRRWPSKLHLAYDAAFPRTDGSRLRDTGNFADDVAGFVRETVDSYSRPATRAAVPGILAAFQREPELAERLRQPHERQIRERFGTMVRTAQERTGARPGFDPDLLFDTIIGAVQFRLIFHQGLDTRFVEDLTDLVLSGTAVPDTDPTSADRSSGHG
jgi:AcrR family transcriptional regulator